MINALAIIGLNPEEPSYVRVNALRTLAPLLPEEGPEGTVADRAAAVLERLIG